MLEFHLCHSLLLSVFQIIDPFVEVEVIGLPVDCFKEQTRVVDDNGKIVWGLGFLMAETSSFRQVLFIKIQVDEIWYLLGQSTEKIDLSILDINQTWVLNFSTELV